MAAVIEVRNPDSRAAIVPFGRALVAGIAVLLGPGARQLRPGLARRDADHDLTDDQRGAGVEAFASIFMASLCIGGGEATAVAVELID